MGYWNGGDVHAQLDHAITNFKIIHLSKKGLSLFDSSTGHSKIPLRSSPRQGSRKGSCAKLMGKQRATTWVGSGRTTRDQPFLFEASGTLLFEAKSARRTLWAPTELCAFELAVWFWSR
jgi:hypothetical protein